MTNRPTFPRHRACSRSLVLSASCWVGAGTAVVSTNALGMGERFDHLVDRVRLALDPPPDRETLPTIEVTDPPLETSAGRQREASGRMPRPRPVAQASRRQAAPESPAACSPHSPPTSWCAVAGTQIVLAMHGVLDNSVEAQRRLAGRIDKWESWKDSHNGGWGPAAIAEALAAHGVKGYEIHAYRRRDLALRDAAAASSRTRAPVSSSPGAERTPGS